MKIAAKYRAGGLSFLIHRRLGLALILCLVTALFTQSEAARMQGTSRLADTRLSSSGQPLFKGSAETLGTDTLEVFVLYVEFKDEGDVENDPLTTGRGTFGSAPIDKKFTLDPGGESIRKRTPYLNKHFEFANNYFKQVSNGRVVIKPRYFPEPDGSGLVQPYQLSQRMKVYNPPDKDEKEKYADFANRKAQAIMSFVWESVKLGDAQANDPKLNPFLAAKKAQEERRENARDTLPQSFMIFHAGHSRLVDGGALGPFNADTPSDFFDFFITQPDFSFLKDITKTGRPDGEPDVNKRKDSLGVQLSTGDTLTEVMMLSESASQDGINWGINGILVNQLARQMGMPDMFDVVKGISQLGYFDLMDFAGYNTLNGFLPVFPSAWVRVFMGWDQPVTARPTGGPYSEYSLGSPLLADDSSGITTLKVPLNEREYLLVENRQRAVGDTFKIYYSTRANEGDLAFQKRDSISLAMDKIDSVFLDSLCNDKGRDCKKNPYKPEGVITGASSYDLGLPGSGLLVWHVNEWFIEQFLKYGAVNAYLGDTLRSQYKGVALVEADGILSLGKEFKDPLGQAVFDYGSGSDMLPHIWKRPKTRNSKDTIQDTIRFIGPYGQANTNAWNDGRTHITLEALLPASPTLGKGLSSFTYDSIFTFREGMLGLRVHWPDNREIVHKTGSRWPVTTAPATRPEALAVVKQGNSRYLLSISDKGHAQIFTDKGEPAVTALDTLKNSLAYDSVFTKLPTGNSRDTLHVPIHSLGEALGEHVGSAVLQDSILVTATRTALYFLHLDADSLAALSPRSAQVETVTVAITTGPVVFDGAAWIVDTDRRLQGYTPDGGLKASMQLPAGQYHRLAAFAPDGGANSGQGESGFQLAVSAQGGRLVVVDPVTQQVRNLPLAWKGLTISESEFFTVSAADFNRDGDCELLILGSRGSAQIVDLQGHSLPQFPQRFPRSIRFTGEKESYESADRSAPALADLDQDGYVDIIFSGSNGIFAVDRHGAPLPGKWPFALEKRQSVGFLYANKQFPETVIGSSPLVLTLEGSPAVLTASPDGLLWALDAKGRAVTTSSFENNKSRWQGVLSVNRSDWPLSIGGSSADTNRTPYIHIQAQELDGSDDLELMAQTGTGTIQVWTLKRAGRKAGADWTLPGGNAQRWNYLSSNGLAKVAAGGGEARIDEFYLFPSPVRGATATVRLNISRAAERAAIKVYDLAGNVVAKREWQGLTPGLQPFTQVLDLKHLGPDIYSAQVEVWFEGGTKQRKWERFGVIR